MPTRQKKLLFWSLLIAGILGSGMILFQHVSNSSLKTSVPYASTRIIEVRALENQWTFEPRDIVIYEGEHIVLAIFNEDNYAHGFAVPALSINEFLPPKSEVQLEFTATKIGSFGVFCSVPCGEKHSSMTGRIIVEQAP